MKLSKKNIGIITITLLVIGIASWFLITRNNKSEQAEQQDIKISKEVTEQDEQNNQKNIVEDKNEELVWYEIPELNIKFKIPKQMASLIGYRDFYVQDVKADGKELYIKKFEKFYPNKGGSIDSFAMLLNYELDADKKHLKNSKMILGKDVCSDSVLIKINTKAVCYIPTSTVAWNKQNGNYETFQKYIKMLFDGYLKYAVVKQIQANK